MYMWGNSYSGSNNIHHNFPPLMDDGRIFTTWHSSSVVNNTIKDNAGMKTNWDYRKYMIENSNRIIKNDKIISGFMTENLEDDGMTDMPKKSEFSFFKQIDQSKNGRQPSDLKEEYLSRFDLQKRRDIPVLSQEQLFSFKQPN